MPGLVPGIHVLAMQQQRKTWMAGTSPAMTSLVLNERGQHDRISDSALISRADRDRGVGGIFASAEIIQFIPRRRTGSRLGRLNVIFSSRFNP